MLCMDNTEIRRTVAAMSLSALILMPTVCSGKSKPKMTVQLYAQDFHILAGSIGVFQVYLVLPDGSRAKAECSNSFTNSKPCNLDSFAPEKRIVQKCSSPDSGFPAECLSNEMYYAERKVNDITIQGANAKVTYHIIGSWTEFTLLPPKQ